MRAFAQTVARDITSEGPAAWRRHFSDSPSFFMAAEGRLEFPDSAAASRGIQISRRSSSTSSCVGATTYASIRLLRSSR